MRRVVWLAVLGAIAVAGVLSGAGDPFAASNLQAKLIQQVAGGGVTVTATLSKEQGEATAIKIAFNTHSVDLNGYQFEKIVALRDESGRTYPLQAVENASGSGHHRQAVLRFGQVTPQARTIELIVKDVAGVKERIFRWSVAE